MSIQLKPLFLTSRTIRVTHIRHEFKVENVSYDLDKICSYDLRAPLCNECFLIAGPGSTHDWPSDIGAAPSGPEVTSLQKQDSLLVFLNVRRI
jgi:hypothetical protein